jgi:hypothetical protein
MLTARFIFGNLLIWSAFFFYLLSPESPAWRRAKPKVAASLGRLFIFEYYSLGFTLISSLMLR